ncbi:hypothetical protein CAP51_14200 [Acinetobacter populi]|uniref:Uncharacterized protein n=2 Tax=Acinetobacter populi TaxID=1582270 RepID=A0A1Z9YUJ3_9GAMM|nr:hypothetical protein CAP51_14200 [Acinetobacter populi]
MGIFRDFTVSVGLSAPTASGLGIAAATLSPSVSYEIGQYFKGNDAEGSAAHILAHTVLGAAVAAAGGNDALTAGLVAGGSEAAAPKLAQYLYGKDAQDLTADEKSTISAIVGLAGSAVGASTGDVASTVQAGQVAQNAVENNEMSLPFPLDPKLGQGYESIARYAQENGLSDEDTQKLIEDFNRRSGLSDQGNEYVQGLAFGSIEMAASAIVPEIAIKKLEPIAVIAKESGIWNKVTDTVKGWFGRGDDKLAETIKNNIEVSQAVREASNFQKFSTKEGKLQEELGIWPPNSGGYATKPAETLQPGTIVDRYGYPGGSYVSPVGTPFEQRALPSSSLNKPYSQYEVIQPINPVSESKILPWFGQPGQGTQYKLPKSVSELLDSKNPYLKEKP